MSEPPFSIGIEEEYLLVDSKTYQLTEAPESLVDDCLADMAGQVSPEFLQCQIEVGTKVCATISDARDDLRRLRATVSKCAGVYGLTPIAVSCHPSADWKTQHHTNKDRYNDLERDLGGVVRRMLISGMHVHVGTGEDNELRTDLCNQFSYFLPHLLALSASSPFWQGDDTGLASYRMSVFDNLPRTGLPPQFDSYSDYRRSVEVLINLDIIEDTSKIWWDMRPSERFPTVETRICDVSPRLEHSLTLAALTQATMRMLWRLKTRNQRWRIYDSFLIGENRWRAQRYGTRDGLIDFGRREIVPMGELIDEWLSLIAEDAEALDCTTEIENVRNMLTMGTSADRQRAVLSEALARGEDLPAGWNAVVAHLVEEFHADL
ncbi:MAG: carboxylate-amine ligase [Rhodobacteraceae bacterium]|nr:carboxylate-amine ligase [Paracoccaceae bacterium]